MENQKKWNGCYGGLDAQTQQITIRIRMNESEFDVDEVVIAPKQEMNWIWIPKRLNVYYVERWFQQIDLCKPPVTKLATTVTLQKDNDEGQSLEI